MYRVALDSLAVYYLDCAFLVHSWMDAVYDAAEAMDDLYLLRLLFDLECHERIAWPIHFVAGSILKSDNRMIKIAWISNRMIKIEANLREIWESLHTFRLIAIAVVNHCRCKRTIWIGRYIVAQW